MTDEKKVPEVGKVYETKEVAEKGLPQGTLVKVKEVDGDNVTVERAGGGTVVLRIAQLIGFLLIVAGCYFLMR